MSDTATIAIDPAEAGERVDVVVSKHLPDITRSLARKMIDNGHILLNGQTTKAAQRVSARDVVQVAPVRPASLSAEPEAIPLEVVYRDSELAIINKPAGLVVHPAAGHPSGTLANALTYLFPETRGVGPGERPGIVHRLDKDTSGLMAVALTAEAQQALQHQIARRSAERRYLALASGHVHPGLGTIDAPIGRDPHNRKRMAVAGVAARSAQTSYTVIEYLPRFTLIECRLHTGRTHQIRVHLAAVGHPLAGDELYHGADIAGLERQFLHAYQLALDSPSTGQRLQFDSSLPADLQSVLESLQAQL